jgi:hypothetical protein
MAGGAVEKWPTWQLRATEWPDWRFKTTFGHFGRPVPPYLLDDTANPIFLARSEETPGPSFYSKKCHTACTAGRTGRGS